MGLVTKNAITLLVSQVATWAVSFVMLIVVPQRLGDGQFGQLSFAVSFVGFFGLFAGLGGGTFIVKQTARDPDRVGLFVFNALLMSLCLSCLLSGAAIGAAYVLGYPAQICIIVALLCIGMIVGSMNLMLVAGLQGQQRMARPAVWGMVDRYGNGVAVLAALLTRRGLLGVAVALSTFGWASFLGNAAQLFRQLRTGARLDLRLWKVLALGGVPFLLWNLVLRFYGSIDIILLSKMTNDTVVGWYALAYRLVGLPIFLPTIMVTALLPQLSTYGTSSSPIFAAYVNRALRLVFFACAPMAAGVALVAGDLIAFLHYPVEFTRSVPLIQILALHIPVVGITTVLGTALMACDRQKSWVVVGIIASVFNPLVNLFAIPASAKAYGNGAIGASVITVATELIMLFGAVYLLRSSEVFDRLTLGYMLRCVVACSVMAGVVIICGDIWLPARIVVGMIAYGLASWALGTFSITELRRRILQMRAFVGVRAAPSVT